MDRTAKLYLDMMNNRWPLTNGDVMSPTDEEIEAGMEETGAATTSFQAEGVGGDVGGTGPPYDTI